jgi:outer membrane protein assembly factor BamB
MISLNAHVRRLAALLLAASLAACGGGSGGGQAPVSKPSGDWLTLTVSNPDITTYEGEQVDFTITGKYTRSFTKPVYAAIVSTTAIIDPRAEIYPGEREYTGSLKTGLALAPGVHTSNLEIRLCEDDPVVCRSPVPGSPWLVPLKVTVKSKAEGAKRVQVSGPIELVTHEGEAPLWFKVDIKTVGDLGRGANTWVVGVAGVTAPQTDVRRVSENNAEASISTLTGLAPGTYSGNIEVRMCMDGTSVCALPIAGSPWLVPFKLTVKSNINLTPLQAPATASAWSTFQGNAAHTAYVPGTFDPGKFSRRWSRAGSDSGYNNTNLGLTIEDGRIFHTNQGNGSRTGMVQSISEETGAQLWRADLGAQDHVNAPAAADGKVFVTTTGGGNQGLYVLDQKTGALISKTAGSSQGYSYRAPVVVGGSVYTQDGHYGGMRKYASGGGAGWSAYMPQYSYWSPAVDANFVYAFMEGKLYGVRADSGAVEFSIADPEYSWHGYDGISPILTGKQMAIVSDEERLMGFDLAARTRAWSVNNAAGSVPALANDKLYVIGVVNSKLFLEARAPATGALLWSSDALIDERNGGAFKRVIVTTNLAFVSSDSATIAVDLTTGKTVWRHPFGGEMSISDRGVLYMQSINGFISAVNLF